MTIFLSIAVPILTGLILFFIKRVIDRIDKAVNAVDAARDLSSTQHGELKEDVLRTEQRLVLHEETELPRISAMEDQIKEEAERNERAHERIVNRLDWVIAHIVPHRGSPE